MQLWNQRRLPELDARERTHRPLLLARRRLRRAPRRAAARHSLLRGQLRAALRRAGGEAVHRRVSGRPHAHPLHALQQLHQVRPVSGNGRGRGRGAHRHRPLRAHRLDEANGPLPVAHAAWIAAKDQTYFLFGLKQEQLARTQFPLGEFTKPQVRELARELGLPVAEKPDSQEICFVPNGDYAAFIDAYFREQGIAPERNARRDRRYRRPGSGRARGRASLHRRPAARPGHRRAASRST